jgi:mono/diheme cytochrome c family protein
MGTHRTGFPGIRGTSLSVSELFDLLQQPPNNGGGPGVPNGHDYGTVLSDADIIDLVAFSLLGTIDGDTFIRPTTGEFLGDTKRGEAAYTSQGSISCIVCHGADGTAINFGTFQEPEYVGTVAVRNPWEFLHKVRVGQPGTPMPSWLQGGGSNQGAADIGRYAQLTFPTDCVQDAQCDDTVGCTADACDAAGRCIHTPSDSLCSNDDVYCNGGEACDAQLGCLGRGNPCVRPELCNEDLDRCECGVPTATAAGGRYLAITPLPADSAVPVALVVGAPCPGFTPRYAGVPGGPFNVATLVDDPLDAAWLTPSEWGGTVLVAAWDIIPATDYDVWADCGDAITAAPTATTPARTARWGDAVGPFDDGEWGPPDGTVHVLDATAILDRFRAFENAPPMQACDLWGCVVDQRIDIVDVVASVDGFRGMTFQQSTRCVSPCP